MLLRAIKDHAFAIECNVASRLGGMGGGVGRLTIGFLQISSTITPL